MNTTKDTLMAHLIRHAIERNIKTEQELDHFKKEFAKKEKIPTPGNIEMTRAYQALLESGGIAAYKPFQKILQKRKIRSLSGVSVVTVLTKPFYCPGQCVFCPTEQGMPKSYLSNEPGAMRAVLNDFNPMLQATNRLKSLNHQGHPTDKIELIVLGGTFSAYTHAYQTAFIRQLYNALNGTRYRRLKDAQKYNETAKHRAIALSLETRSDHITQNELRRFRGLGCTKIQIGIQTVYDDILKLIKRGETVEQGREAIKLIKDAGFKLGIHMMPNLPGGTPDRDYQMMKTIFENEDYKPDFLKLYPCMVVPYSELEKWWGKGKYKPYDDKTLTELIIRIKKIVPEFVRIERLIRDIPGESILAGSLITNLRQMIQNDRAKHKEWNCRCIRCREIRSDLVEESDIIYKEQNFASSGGHEHFLTFEDKHADKLLSLLRLRFPSQLFTGQKHFIPEIRNATIVREIHTYGFQVGIGKRNAIATQHLGLGHQLLQKAEKITRNAGIKKLAVIASIGTREYYKKWGYELEGTYMVKKI